MIGRPFAEVPNWRGCQPLRSASAATWIACRPEAVCADGSKLCSSGDMRTAYWRSRRARRGSEFADAADAAHVGGALRPGVLGRSVIRGVVALHPLLHLAEAGRELG